MLQLLFLVISVGIGTSYLNVQAALKTPSFRNFQEKGAIMSRNYATGIKIQYYQLLHNGKNFYATLDGNHITHKQQYILGLLTHPGPHTCPICDEVFSRSDVRDRHYKNKHLNLRPYSCSCGLAFKRSDHLQVHCEKKYHLTANGSSATLVNHPTSSSTRKKRSAIINGDDVYLETQLSIQQEDSSHANITPIPVRKSARLAEKQELLLAAGKNHSFFVPTSDEEEDDDDEEAFESEKISEANESAKSETTLTDTEREESPHLIPQSLPPFPTQFLTETTTDKILPLPDPAFLQPLSFDDIIRLLFEP